MSAIATVPAFIDNPEQHFAISGSKTVAALIVLRRARRALTTAEIARQANKLLIAWFAKHPAVRQTIPLAREYTAALNRLRAIGAVSQVRKAGQVRHQAVPAYLANLARAA
jgi:hypothetical protein